MTLYSASLLDLAKPVEKKKRKKVANEPVVAESTSDPQPPPKKVVRKKKTPVAEPTPTPPPTPEKPALENKVEEPLEDAIAAAVATILPKEKKSRKRKIPEPVSATEPIQEAVSRKVVKKRNPEEAPVWFKKYVEGVKKEQAESKTPKVPKKQIAEEAATEANVKWQDGMVRDRLSNEVDGHLNRMYGMIFGKRAMR